MFGIFEENYDSVYKGNHEAKFSHEAVAGAASFAAVKLFEDRQRREGKPVSHAFAKEALAAIAGGESTNYLKPKGWTIWIERDLEIKLSTTLKEVTTTITVNTKNGLQNTDHLLTTKDIK